MKKIMVVCAAVACAIAAQAVQVDWKLGTSALNDGTGVTKATTATMVYLFNAEDYSQSALITAFNAGTSYSDIQKNAIDSASLSSGKMTAWQTVSGDYGTATGNNLQTYFAVFTDDKVYVNATKTSALMTGEGDVTQVAATAYFTPSKTTFDAGATWASGAGWYQAASVPEPTSGLLLILGMAGLALRRRRA